MSKKISLDAQDIAMTTSEQVSPAKLAEVFSGSMQEWWGSESTDD